MSNVKRTRGEKNILLKNHIYMDRHERNVHMMKCSHDERQNERNISVLLTLEYYNRYDFKLYSIKIYCI